MRSWLLDAGPIVALLNSDDPAHTATNAILGRYRGTWLTTSAVITEAFHLLRRDPDGPEALVEFIAASGTKVFDCCQPRDLRSALSLMTKYRDTPMDFADASLVLLADSFDLYHICTLDRRGFTTFRTSKGKHFTLVMDA